MASSKNPDLPQTPTLDLQQTGLLHRRTSFLSPSMIGSESISVYDSYSFVRGSSAYSIISLKECQGYVFNQDLFATPYQQRQSMAREKRAQALMTQKKRSQSHGTVATWPQAAHSRQRRHTSYHAAGPRFRGVPAGSAFSDNSSDMSVDDDGDEPGAAGGGDDMGGDLREKLEVDADRSEGSGARDGADGIDDADDVIREEDEDVVEVDVEDDEDDDDNDDDDDDEFQSYLDMPDYLSNYVPTIDVVVGSSEELYPGEFD